MTCIYYNVYHPDHVDAYGRVSLRRPVAQEVCSQDIPYPPPETICGVREEIRSYYVDLGRMLGMVVCGRSRIISSRSNRR